MKEIMSIKLMEDENGDVSSEIKANDVNGSDAKFLCEEVIPGILAEIIFQGVVIEERDNVVRRIIGNLAKYISILEAKKKKDELNKSN